MKKQKKRRGLILFTLTLLFLVSVSAVTFYFVSVPRYEKTVRADGGVVDFTGRDFSKNIYNLNGEWEFYYERHLSPEDFAGGATKGGTFISVPEAWNKQGYPSEGFATYRLRILTDDPELMLRVPEIAVASVVCVNGEKVFEAGTVGQSAAESVMGARNAFVPVRAENGAAEIIVRVSNYQWADGGLTHEFEIGRADVLTRNTITRLMALAFFIGAALIMGIYHLVLYLRRREDKPYLFFACFCLFISVRFFIETNAFAEILLPGGLSLPLARLYLALIVLQACVCVFFTHSTLGLPYGGMPRRVLYGAAMIITLVLALAAPFPMTGCEFIMLPLLPLLLSIISAARKKTLRRNPYNILYLVAMVTFIIWGPLTKYALNDIYFVPAIANNLFLLLSQVVMLSQSYAEAKREATELAAKTDFYRRMSHDLRTPLTVISTGVQVAMRRPEEAPELLARAQSEVMKMADMIDVILNEEGGE